MGTSILPYRYRVNGLVDTGQSVMSNMDLIANSACTWLTYDATEGKWAVVINTAGIATKLFDDSNIIGPINLTGSGLSNYYNSAEVRFPNKVLRGEVDTVLLEIPEEDRFPNEPDNKLTIDAPLVNDAVQAQIIGLIELKQSRLDTIIQFTTDYSKIDMEAGEIISVTNDVYGWDAKLFRVMRMEQRDDNGAIVIAVTAQEYSDSVYDLSDLYKYIRDDDDGIPMDIEKPDLPDITIENNVAEPGAVITAYVPTGLVDRMLFYVSRFGTDETFVYAGTVFSQGDSFEPGESVQFKYSQIRTGSIYVKVKAGNDTQTSVFSDVATEVCNLVQVADEVDPEYLSGDNFAIILAGSGDGGGYAKLIAGYKSSVTGGAMIGDSTPHTITLVPSLTFPISGDYKVKYFINWGGTGNPGVNGTLKISSITIPGFDLGQWASTGDQHVQLYEDHIVEGLLIGVSQGTTTSLQFTYTTSWPTAAVWIMIEVWLMPPGMFS